jgi:hypothetical protein
VLVGHVRVDGRFNGAPVAEPEGSFRPGWQEPLVAIGGRGRIERADQARRQGAGIGIPGHTHTEPPRAREQREEVDPVPRVGRVARVGRTVCGYCCLQRATR